MKNVDREVVWGVVSPWGSQEPLISTPLPNELMSSLLDNITARIVIADRDHMCTYANREAAVFFGGPGATVIGRHMSELLGRETYEGYLPWMDRLFAGETLRWKGWVMHPVRGRRYVQETLVPYAPRGGKVTALVAFGRDYTDLKLREEQLAERQEQLRASEALKSAIVDHALAALISTDARGMVVEFNPAAEAMFGWARPDVLGRLASEVIIPPRYREAHNAGMARLQADGMESRLLGKRMDMHALRADGTEFPIEMVLWRTIVDGTTFYTASLMDLTERHNAAQQIERQRDALRQSEKLMAMGSLLAGVAHELNNPLAIVMGRASLLEEKCESADLKADVQRIREAAERCGRIVRTFLNMARSKPALRTSVSLNDLVRAATEMLSYSYRTHDIRMSLQLDDGIPNVTADADQIGQVVMNLLVNAQQALASSGAERCVHVQTGVEARRDYREPRVWLRVADNGPGASVALRARLFEPFFTTKPEGMGTGLGLAVSRSLAREHGGDLALEATHAGSGASFRLSLPISGEVRACSSAGFALDQDPTSVSRVLVVDDEPEIANLMRDMLEGGGYEVAIAESGEVALALLDMARFDAIVSDLRMPDMDGAGLWREVQRLHPSMAQRMLFVTGDTLSLDAREFLRKSKCHGLDKPFSKSDLLSRVAELLAPVAVT